MERYFVANTIDNDTDAKNAEGLLFVNTIENETNAKTVEGVRFANMIGKNLLKNFAYTWNPNSKMVCRGRIKARNRMVLGDGM